MKHSWVLTQSFGIAIWVCTECGKLCNAQIFAAAEIAKGDTIINQECHPKMAHHWVVDGIVDQDEQWVCTRCNAKVSNLEELINCTKCCNGIDTSQLPITLTRLELESMVRDLCGWIIAYHKLPTDILNKKATATLDKLNAAVASYNENMSDTR